jgi:hypothetical protein
VLLQPADGGGFTSKICDFGCAQDIGSGALQIATCGDDCMLARPIAHANDTLSH